MQAALKPATYTALPTRRQEVLAIAKTLSATVPASEHPQTLIVTTNDQDAYIDNIEPIFATYSLAFNAEFNKPLAYTQLWKAWLVGHSFFSNVKVQQPLLNDLRRLAYAGVFDVDIPAVAQVLRGLHKVDRFASLSDLIEFLDNLTLDQATDTNATTTIADKLKAFEFANNWLPEEKQQRLALLTWIARDCSTEKLQGMAQIRQQLEQPWQSTGMVDLDYRIHQDSLDVVHKATNGVHILTRVQLRNVDVSAYKHVFVLGCDKTNARLLQKFSDKNNVYLTSAQYDTSGSERTLPTLAHLQEAVPHLKLSTGSAEKSNGQQTKPSSPKPPLATSMTKAPFAEQTQPLQFSVSQISEFALCPYRYFADYRLGLKEPDDTSHWQLSARRLGELAHHLFETQLTKVVAGVEVGETQLQEEAEAFMPGLLRSAFHGQQWQRLRQEIAQALKDEALHIRVNSASISELEKKVELPLEVVVGEKTHVCTIRGRIDRIDLIDGVGLVIVDYKSSRASLGPSERQEIVDLVRPQLPIYILALQRLQEQQNNDLRVVGATEYRFRIGKRGGVVLDNFKARFKSALYNKLQVEDFLPHFKHELNQLMTSLLTSDFQPRPRKSSICGFDTCSHWQLCRYDKDAEINVQESTC